MNYNFTYVIGYRHKPDRLNNLRRVIDWVNGFSGVEVLLIEQDKHTKISHLNLPAKHIFIKSNVPYNKSWSFNVALKYAKSNIIVYGDSDLIMDPHKFIEAIKVVADGCEMVSPYNSVVDLTPQESNMSFEEILKINRIGRGEAANDIEKVPLCGGICLFRKEALVKIGGWNEDFLSWGGEDDSQSFVVKNFLNWKEMTAKCYHLYHDRTQPDLKYYQRNLQLLQKISQMSKEQLQKMITSKIPRIGMKNKYDNF
jgi:cellulose synthase/poly-beta-1,6-N-acetylglucosamine synthase-like glycosyltransferase